ncbi:YncE family protein [Allofranklinella schreckenbergeri]|uniref:YncE family protein n=1 Tax=Allofranklinella schreckenbergeri TaxID=1076744 RepID=A0A3M6Q764_9BURK|nr:YncE family protein [Allofranklinella schreckenbergeri]RMW99005.1 YncE family protein [Allofranklinella schreckenbergeri]
MKLSHRFLTTAAAAALAATLAGCAHQGQAPANAAAKAVQAGAQAQPQVVRQAVAPGLYELAYSPKFNAVFVNSSGGFGKDAPASRLLRLDPQSLAVLGEIPLQRRGFGMALDEDAGRIYIGNTIDSSVTVIDIASGKTLGVVQLAKKVQAPGRDGKMQERYEHRFRQLVLDKANGRLFMPGMDSKNSALYVVDTRALKVEKVIPGLGFTATGIALDEAAGKVYVSNQQGQLFTVDARTLKLEKKHEIALDQPLNLTFDAKSKRLFAVDQGLDAFNQSRERAGIKDYVSRGRGDRIVALDPKNGSLLASQPTKGKGPVALLADAERGRLWVTTREGASVEVFHLKTFQPLQRFDLPSHPNSLSLDAQTGAVYATVKNGKNDAKGSNESVVRLSF